VTIGAETFPTTRNGLTSHNDNHWVAVVVVLLFFMFGLFFTLLFRRKQDPISLHPSLHHSKLQSPQDSSGNSSLAITPRKIDEKDFPMPREVRTGRRLSVPANHSLYMHPTFQFSLTGPLPPPPSADISSPIVLEELSIFQVCDTSSLSGDDKSTTSEAFSNSTSAYLPSQTEPVSHPRHHHRLRNQEMNERLSHSPGGLYDNDSNSTNINIESISLMQYT